MYDLNKVIFLQIMTVILMFISMVVFYRLQQPLVTEIKILNRDAMERFDEVDYDIVLLEKRAAYIERNMVTKSDIKNLTTIDKEFKIE